MKGIFMQICSLISGVGTNMTDCKHVIKTRKHEITYPGTTNLSAVQTFNKSTLYFLSHLPYTYRHVHIRHSA